MDKVITKQLPQLTPNEADSAHIKVCNFDKGLQTKLPWIGLISKFFF